MSDLVDWKKVTLNVGTPYELTPQKRKMHDTSITLGSGDLQIIVSSLKEAVRETERAIQEFEEYERAETDREKITKLENGVLHVKVASEMVLGVAPRLYHRRVELGNAGGNLLRCLVGPDGGDKARDRVRTYHNRYEAVGGPQMYAGYYQYRSGCRIVKNHAIAKVIQNLRRKFFLGDDNPQARLTRHEFCSGQAVWHPWRKEYVFVVVELADKIYFVCPSDMSGKRFARKSTVHALVDDQGKLVVGPYVEVWEKRGL